MLAESLDGEIYERWIKESDSGYYQLFSWTWSEGIDGIINRDERGR